jgi:hypothetical protein
MGSKRGGGSQRATAAKKTGNRGGNRGGPSSANDPTRQKKAGGKGKTMRARAGAGRPKLEGSMGRGPQPSPRS